MVMLGERAHQFLYIGALSIVPLALRAFPLAIDNLSIPVSRASVMSSDHQYAPVGAQVASKTRRSMKLLGVTASIILFTILGAIGLRVRNSPQEFQSSDGPASWMTSNFPRVVASGDLYLLGVGKADITGPVVEINMMGYADLNQVGSGLRQRIYARTFIMGSTTNPSQRTVYMVLDTQAGDTGIRYGILAGVAALGSAYSVYGKQNIAVTGTHSHAGPGAWHNYLLPQITSLGLNKQSYQAIVDGAVLSIKRAHESLAPGYLDFGTTNVAGANINRSPYAYLANPATERALYADNVDKALDMLRFKRASDGKSIGVLTWFAVHGTSLLQNSTHIAGDNKGVAAYLFEKSMAADAGAASGFVAGFSQANVGDTTPQTLGAWCDDGSSQMCSFENSTCSGISQTCHGRGPKFQKLDLGVSSCFEIGQKQFSGAKALYATFDTVSTPITDPTVKSFHFYNDMSSFNFLLANGTAAKTCPAALGYSFAAGTSDGPGAFDFAQGDSGEASANPLWAVVVKLISPPSAAQIACQYPKPVLLNTGELTAPYNWSPNIVDIQVLRVGQLFMIIAPGEATTMAGRRWRKAIAAAATSTLSYTNPLVVLGGPANTYAHYIATQEEYGIQRYEGASTLYGPHTLAAYVNLTVSNLKYLSSTSSTSPPAGPPPPDNVANSLSFITGVAFDSAPIGTTFGSVLDNVSPSYTVGAVVNATFVGANPRNNLHLETTFSAVELYSTATNSWTVVRNDEDWSLTYTWTRLNGLLGTSSVVLSWETGTDPVSVAKGKYRFTYYGDSKNLLGAITPFVGHSGNFTLV